MIGVNPTRPSGATRMAAEGTNTPKIQPVAVTQTFSEHTHYVTCLDILNGNTFVSGSFDTFVKQWIATSDKSQKTYNQGDLVNAIAVLNDHTCIAIGFGPYNNSIRIFNLSNGQYHPLNGHTDYVSAFSVSKEGFLASGSRDGTVRIWKPFSSECTNQFDCKALVYCVKFLSDGKTVIAGNSKGEIQFWDYTSANTSPYQIFQKNTAAICSLAVMKDGTIASGSDDCIVRTWDPSLKPEQALKKELAGHTGHVPALAVRFDNILVSGSSDRTIMLWNTSTGESWQSPAEHNGIINALLTLEDNSILSASYDHTIKLWK